MVKEYELYVLRLEQGRYYVGQTGRLRRRIEQHAAGNGASWTKLYPPIERVKTYSLTTADIKEVERLEDELTIDTMIQYGWRNVRGGHFCNIDDRDTEMALRAYGRFDQVLQSAHRLSSKRATRLSTWMEAIRDLMENAERYYDLGFPLERRDEVLDAFVALKQFPEWRDDLTPALDVAFWDRKGLLPVLLSFLRNRVIGCRLQDPFAVLATAMQRGRGGQRPWNRLLLVTWQVCNPPISTGQQGKLDHWMRNMIAQPLSAFDTRYDAFVSIAFPKTRHWLRQVDLRSLLYDVHST